MKRPTIITSVTAEGKGRISDDLGLQLQRTRTKTRQGSLVSTVIPGVVKVDIEHQRTVESVGVCGIDMDGNPIVGYGADPGSDAESVLDAKTDNTRSNEEVDIESGRKEKSGIERRGSGWVREGRLMAERIGVGGGTSAGGSRAGLVVGCAPMARSDI